MKLTELYSSLHKLQNKSLAFDGVVDGIVDWFDNTDYGVGLPFLFVLVFLLLLLDW
jgi:hypothetical protein